MKKSELSLPVRAKLYYEKNKETILAQKRIYRAEHPTANRDYHQANKTALRKKARAKKFGLTLEQVEQLHIDHDHKCAICKVEVSGKGACIDHCHNTNKIRGLLCINCNFMLGSARDNIQTLQAGITYLTKSMK
jgi:DNA repair exonuclease SbcCD ATPase subunit